MLRRLLILLYVSAALTGCSHQPTDVGSPTTSPTTLQGRWWTWAATEPSGSNPIDDRTGEFCTRNQPADMWFLAGTFGGEAHRRCSVPQGRLIVVPIVNLYSGDPADCIDFMQVATGSVSLDGKVLPTDRIDGEPIVVTAAPGNAMGQKAGTFRATGCGLWARVAPLTPGSHQLHVDGESGDFAVVVDYDLEVIG